jgi:hypothetical protein
MICFAVYNRRVLASGSLVRRLMTGRLARMVSFGCTETVCYFISSSTYSNTGLLAGTGKSVLWYVTHAASSPFPDASTVSSCIIDILAANSSSELCVAYFYFDFKDEKKKSLSGLLSSLVFQLSASSRECFDILRNARARVQKMNNNTFSKIHAHAHLRPTDDMLIEYLEAMLRASSEIFIVLDALDECPEVKRASDVFPFLQRLVALEIRGVHILVTSRPESDIRRHMNQIASHCLDLHTMHEHSTDLALYISHELSLEIYADWPQHVRLHAEKMLFEKARGM